MTSHVNIYSCQRPLQISSLENIATMSIFPKYYQVRIRKLFLMLLQLFTCITVSLTFYAISQ